VTLLAGYSYIIEAKGREEEKEEGRGEDRPCDVMYLCSFLSRF